MSKSLYQKMKDKGLDMSWYDKSRGEGSKPRQDVLLEDSQCSRLSVYMVDPQGRMYTLTSSGEPYMIVRTGIPNTSGQAVYVCLHCKQQWNDYDTAISHTPKEAVNGKG